MPEAFESEEEDFDLDEAEDFAPPPRRGRAKTDNLPDGPVDNAADLPLLTHAGTTKSNTVTYLKVTRLDGPRGVRGVKGKMVPESTYEDVARRYGNGTYKIEGCNQKHKVLAREEGLEISIPGFDEDDGPKGMPQAQPSASPSFGLHGMQMISQMAGRQNEVVRDQATALSSQVEQMANKTLEMMTAFTAAQRESERNAYQAAQANQQAFFAQMQATMQAAHAQQMEMLTAMHERSRKQEVDPMSMIQVFMDGIKAGGELGGGGEGVEPWLAALKEGTGMLGHMAQLANSPAVAARLPSGQAPALPGQPQARQLPGPAQNPDGAPVRRKKRLPFQKQEIRGMAQLKAVLRKRGIPLEDFLAQTTDYYQSAPESDLFESDDDGPVESESHAAHDSTEDPATE